MKRKEFKNIIEKLINEGYTFMDIKKEYRKQKQLDYNNQGTQTPLYLGNETIYNRYSLQKLRDKEREENEDKPMTFIKEKPQILFFD